MPRGKVPRRRHPVDRFVFSNAPPIPIITESSSCESTVRDLQLRLRDDLKQLLPIASNTNPSPDSLSSVILTLSGATLHYDGDSPSKSFIDAVLQTGFIDDLLHALRVLLLSKSTKRARVFLPRLLSTLHMYVSSSELLANRLADNHLCLPLLLSPMQSQYATDIAIWLAEEVLHASPRWAHFELAPLTGIVDVINSLSPFQLGTMCRVLALYIDERDNSVPCAVNADTASVCTLSSYAPCNPDWRQIEKPSELLKARRSYLDPRGKLSRERNQATLLSIPDFIQKLVKIISIPPPCREDIHVIDDALRVGFQSTSNNNNNNDDNNNNINANNNDNGNENNNNDHNVNIQNGDNNIATEGGPAAINVPVTPGGAADENAGPQPNNAFVNQMRNDIREQILLLMLRRLTGAHSDDNRLIHVDTWPVLDGRIEEAEQEWLETGFVNRAVRSRPHASAEDQEHLFNALQPVNAVVDGTVEIIVQNVTVQPAVPGGVLLAQVEDAYVIGIGEDGVPDDMVNGGAPGAHHVHADEPEGEANVEVSEATNDTPVNTNGVTGDPTDDNDQHANGNMDPEQGPEDDHSEIFRDQLLSIMSNVMVTHQVEALFIMYTLLGGKRRADVRTRLIDAGIFPALNRFFDALDWSDPLKESRTEDTLKVHLLRLIHYLCDGMDENTFVQQTNHLFTSSEQEIISAIGKGSWKEQYVVRPVRIIRHGKYVGSNVMKASLQLISERDQQVCGDSEKGCGLRTKLQHFCPIVGECKICSYGSVKAVQNSPRRVQRDVQDDESCIPNINHERGLMMKVVQVLMNTTGRDEMSIGRRYLLSGCVETFQRGATMAEKSFVGRQGLLRHLLEQLCYSKHLTSHMNQFRQTSFDLLGHLIKWNRELFDLMNELLLGNHRLLSGLLGAVSDRLIDSNVFVRSVALSLERFRAEDQQAARCGKGEAEYTSYEFDRCVLWEFIEEWRVRIVYDLMASVRVDDVNYENISCVNTTLIMFVVSCEDERALDKLLRCVFEYTKDKFYQQHGSRKERDLLSIPPEDVLDNFNKVVDFWINYYRYQGTDVNSLEMSTNIAFDHFVYIANLLQQRLPTAAESIHKMAMASVGTES